MIGRRPRRIDDRKCLDFGRCKGKHGSGVYGDQRKETELTLVAQCPSWSIHR